MLPLNALFEIVLGLPKGDFNGIQTSIAFGLFDELLIIEFGFLIELLLKVNGLLIKFALEIIPLLHVVH